MRHGRGNQRLAGRGDAEEVPHALPPAMPNPRVAIEPDGIMLGCRYQQGGVD